MSQVESLGKYEIRRVLGRGAMGTVYEGFDPVIERIVAIKTVRLPESPDEETAEEIARFRREAQAAGRLTHPNIVGVFDYGETADIAYIVMEYVDGPSLKSLLDKNERFPLPRVAQIMEDLLAGLQFSHERGVVHRDIKPANLMLTKTGQGKIADFGIARIESSSMTQAGTVLGTPAYMSPEQFMGQVVDARSDIYSSGVLLYQLLTGERPFEGSMSAIMHKALNTEAPMPSQISVTAPRQFDAVVRKAMAKRPEDRYSNASEFMAAIRNALSAPPPVEEPEDNAEATVIAVPRPAAPVTPQMTAASLASVISPPAATGVTAAPPAKTGGGSVVPIAIGGGVAALLIAGGLGYYFLMPGPGPTPPKPEPQKPVIEEPTKPPGPGTTEPTRPPGPISGPGTTEPVKPPGPGPGTGPVSTEPVKPPGPVVVEPVKPPVDPSAAYRAEIGNFVASLQCSMFDGDIRDGVVNMAGIGNRAAIDSVRQKLAGMGLPSPPPALRLVQVDQSFCQWEDLLRPLAKTFGQPGARLSLRIEGDPAFLKKDDYIRPRLVMGDFRGNLRVDYLDRDGNVQHLFPQLADPAQHMAANPMRTFDPGESLVLGDPGPDNPGWQVDEPYGTDMIIAIASEDALFDQQRSANVEKAAPYLRDLRKALEAAKSRGARVTATAMSLETRKQ